MKLPIIDGQMLPHIHALSKLSWRLQALKKRSYIETRIKI